MEFAAFFVCQIIAMVIVILEKLWKDVTDGLSLGVAHGEHGGKGAFGHKLMLESIAVAVATDYAANLPEAKVVEEFTTWDSDFAH